MRRILCLPFTLALLTLLCTCGRAPETAAIQAVGNVRYLENNQVIVATLNLSPADSSASALAPTFLKQPMPRMDRAGAGSFRIRRNLHFPEHISLSVPCGSGADCPVKYTFAPVFPDSIPGTISLDKTSSFPVATSGLTEEESIVVFFEPDDRSAPKRIQLLGPTDTGKLTLPKNAMADITPGNYQVYLVKQQLYKDSTATLNVSIQTEYFTRNVPVLVE